MLCASAAPDDGKKGWESFSPAKIPLNFWGCIHNGFVIYFGQKTETLNLGKENRSDDQVSTDTDAHGKVEFPRPAGRQNHCEHHFFLHDSGPGQRGKNRNPRLWQLHRAILSVLSGAEPADGHEGRRVAQETALLQSRERIKGTGGQTRPPLQKDKFFPDFLPRPSITCVFFFELGSFSEVCGVCVWRFFSFSF